MADDSTTKLQALLDRFVAGDRAARDELISNAYKRLQRLARRMFRDFQRLRPYGDTTDVLHQSFPRLARALDATPPGTVADFFQLAALQMRRELLDLVDHYYGPEGPGGKHVPQPANDDSSNTPEPAGQDSTRSYSPQEMAEWTEFHRAVEALPDAERRVFELLWYHEMTQAEAAAILQCSEITVRRRWLEARRRLGAVLRGSAALP
jgi:RNA polymerase sigma-70 factor (ECF subfamily)